MLPTPILQFGTSRFLLAHVDLFVSEALQASRAGAGDALGGITVVQSTASPASAARTAALASGAGYPVRIRGIEGGQPVDRVQQATAVRQALQAPSQWPGLRALLRGPDVQVIVSNTADQGYALDAADQAALLDADSPAPRSFPAKLLVLLHARWQGSPQALLTLLPCELVERNGDVLRELVQGLARQWALPEASVHWLGTHCVWANSLVDRIVSEAIEPVGAVAEPYALWAIERQPGLVLPCRHPAIVLTDDLASHARLKLFLLNGGHTFLAERWQRDGRPATETVGQALTDDALRAELEALWRDEIIPVFAALGQGAQARTYVDSVRERLQNPYLDHRLADIAQNHAQKKQRRLAPIVALAHEQGLRHAQPRLQAALAA
ncbi:MAG: Altronate oxidoreductase [Paracidovorax wautersii]|uniref:Altronate oxidoreductase n=1 Tax=Paracidovorax wautersii TaxID=1177982 RepID=A0A7V8FMR2_9BURK|nr:MAG: Altronate oxidoreductase [Paracidovorax wautersii]